MVQFIFVLAFFFLLIQRTYPSTLLASCCSSHKPDEIPMGASCPQNCLPTQRTRFIRLEAHYDYDSQSPEDLLPAAAHVVIRVTGGAAPPSLGSAGFGSAQRGSAACRAGPLGGGGGGSVSRAAAAGRAGGAARHVSALSPPRRHLVCGGPGPGVARGLRCREPPPRSPGAAAPPWGLWEARSWGAGPLLPDRAALRRAAGAVRLRPSAFNTENRCFS